MNPKKRQSTPLNGKAKVRQKPKFFISDLNIKDTLHSLAQKETTFFSKSNYPVSFKPFLVTQGVVVLLLFLITASIFIFPQANSVDTALVIKSAAIKQTSTVIVGQPVTWTALIKRSDITSEQYLLKLPKNATNIKVTAVSATQAGEILTAAPKQQLSLSQRQQIASASQPRSFLLASILDSIKKLFLSSVKDGIEEIFNPDTTEVQTTEDAKVVDLSAQAGLSDQQTKQEEKKQDPKGTPEEKKEAKETKEEAKEETPTPTETPAEEPVPEEIPAPAEEQPVVETPTETPAEEPVPEEIPAEASRSQSDRGSSTAEPSGPTEAPSEDTAGPIISSDQEVIGTPAEEIQEEYVKIEYETPAPGNTERTTRTGKIVTVSVEESQISSCPQQSDSTLDTTLQSPLTLNILNKSMAGLTEGVKNFFSSISKFFLADLGGKALDVISDITDQITTPAPQKTPSVEQPVEEPTPSMNSGQAEQEEKKQEEKKETKVEIPEIAVETETPVEEPAENTNPSEQSIITPPEDPILNDQEQISDVPGCPSQLTGVLTYTNIPEIYNVGEENKIKIKWRNNKNQKVEFDAYDTDDNGKLDYIEWVVPHLSKQIFEIIFTSKVFQIDGKKNIVANIYDKLKVQDDKWATIKNGQYIRVAFSKALDNTKDITIYARPNPSTSSRQVEVYPAYIDKDGNTTEGPLAGTFEFIKPDNPDDSGNNNPPENNTNNQGGVLSGISDFVSQLFGGNSLSNNIDHEDSYNVKLTNLQEPTNVFYLKVSGNIDLDFISNPPDDLTISNEPTTNSLESPNWEAGLGGGNVNVDEINAALDEGKTVTLKAEGDVILNDPIVKSGGSDSPLNIIAGNSIVSNSSINSSSNISLSSEDNENSSGRIEIIGELNSNGGQINLSSGVVMFNAQATSSSSQITVSSRNILQQGTIVSNDINLKFTGAYIDSEKSITAGNNIYLNGSTGSASHIFASGKYDVSGDNGGSITFEAINFVKLYGAKLNASGDSQGGTIKIGGDMHGQGSMVQSHETVISPTTTLKANGNTGNGGTIVVWSDKSTKFDGLANAKSTDAAGGTIEISSSGDLSISSDAKTDASSENGAAGTILFDPKNITISSSGQAPAGTMYYFELVDPNPDTGTYGQQIGYNFLNVSSTIALAAVPITNGNVPVADTGDDLVASNAGAVYLFNGETGALISTITGTTASDQVGSSSISALTNGNYVIRSSAWDNGAVTDAGAVTWCSGASGCSGTVSTSNSLVGSTNSDQMGSSSVPFMFLTLSNGNYVVSNWNWDNGAVVDAGGVILCNGTTNSCAGQTMNTSNSLYGTTAADKICYGPSSAMYEASDGNYIIASTVWDNGAVVDAGAVTWCNATTNSCAGQPVSVSNSLVGSTTNDNVGSIIRVLSNGNYVVGNYNWDNGAATNAGAVTWCSGTTGCFGAVSTSNSLYGTQTNDNVGTIPPALLTNGNYVSANYAWDNGAATNAGAVTWCNGTTGSCNGQAVSTSNSLYGTTASDQIGYTYRALSNGNYTAGSPYWDNGGKADIGAVVWCSGTTGCVGAVSTSNSLYGGTASDGVYLQAYALTNGNYVVAMPGWNNGATVDAGAVIWGDGVNGTTGVVSTSNSLYGTTTSDQVGSNANGRNFITTLLVNGNYVVGSPFWDNGATANVGALTWCNGTTNSCNGQAVSTSNSIYGATANDSIGAVSSGTTGPRTLALANGNFVNSSGGWDNSPATDVGATTFINGTTGTTGIVSISNSLYGTTTNDGVAALTGLSNGNYVAYNANWDNGATVNAGEITLCSGTTGCAGAISSSNSIIGPTASASMAIPRDYVVNNHTIASFFQATAQKVYSVSSNMFTSSPSSYTFAYDPTATYTLTPAFLTAVLNTGSNVVLQANNDITISSAITASNGSGNGGNLTLQAGRSILINANITTDDGNLALYANEKASTGVVDANRSSGTAAITMQAGTTINAGAGTVDIRLDNGLGNTYTAGGNIALVTVTGGAVTLTNNNTGGAITQTGVMTAGTLNVTNTSAATTLTQSNVIAALGTVNCTGQTFTLTNTATTTQTGVLTASLFVYTNITANTTLDQANVITSLGTVNATGRTFSLTNTIALAQSGVLTATTFNYTNTSADTTLNTQTNVVTNLGTINASGRTFSFKVNAALAQNGVLTATTFNLINSGGNSTLTQSNVISTLGTINATGRVLLLTNTATTTQSGVLTATSLVYVNSSADTTLDQNNAIGILGPINATGRTFTLTNTVTTTQTPSPLTASTFNYTNTSAATTLTQSNVIGALGTVNCTGQTFTLTNTATTTQTGILTATTFVYTNTSANTTLDQSNVITNLGAITATGRTFTLINNVAAGLTVTGAIGATTVNLTNSGPIYGNGSATITATTLNLTADGYDIGDATHVIPTSVPFDGSTSITGSHNNIYLTNSQTMTTLTIGAMNNSADTTISYNRKIALTGNITTSGSANISIISDSGMCTLSGINAGGNLSFSQYSSGGPGFTLSTDISMGGNLTIGTSTSLSAGSYNISVGGNWTNNGTFSSTGTVTLNGTSQKVFGTTSFNNLTKDVSSASADTLMFENSKTQTVGGTLTLTGASGKVLTLRSCNSSGVQSDGTQWSINPQGTRTISYLDVMDSNNTNGTGIDTAGLNITDSGNNTNWVFDITAPTVTDNVPGSWQTTDITVTLTCDDGEGVGCSKVYYTLDGNDPTTGSSYVDASSSWQFVYSTEGQAILKYRGEDTVGNLEATVTAVNSLRIDATAPTVNAGADQAKTALFTQTGSATDALSGVASYQWSKVSGSGTITFGTATSAETTISASADGTYVIRLTATDIAGNSASDDFTLVWSTASAGGSVLQPNQTILGQLAQQLNNLRQQIQNFANIFNLTPDTQISYPPIEEAVPQEPQIVFQGGNIISQKDFDKIDILPLPQEIKDLAFKFPKFASTLESVGISKSEDIEKLKVVTLTFPSLSEVAGVPADLAFSEFTKEEKQKIPSNIIFAKIGADNIDLNIKVTISDLNKPIQSISTIQNKPLYLTVKPDNPASSIKGYIIFRSANSQAALLDYINKLSGGSAASLLDATKGATVKKDIVLSEFDYVDVGGIWNAKIKSPEVDGRYEIKTVIQYQEETIDNKSTENLSMILVVDPEGYIYEKTGINRETRINNAKVSIYWLNPDIKKYELWPAKDYQQENPQTTDITGRYSFLVPPGTYYLKVESQDYITYSGSPFQLERGKGVHENIELKVKNWWLKLFTPERIMLGFVITLLISIFVIMLLKKKNNQ